MASNLVATVTTAAPDTNSEQYTVLLSFGTALLCQCAVGALLAHACTLGGEPALPVVLLRLNAAAKPTAAGGPPAATTAARPTGPVGPRLPPAAPVAPAAVDLLAAALAAPVVTPAPVAPTPVVAPPPPAAAPPVVAARPGPTAIPTTSRPGAPARNRSARRVPQKALPQARTAPIPALPEPTHVTPIDRPTLAVPTPTVNTANLLDFSRLHAALAAARDGRQRGIDRGHSATAAVGKPSGPTTAPASALAGNGGGPSGARADARGDGRGGDPSARTAAREGGVSGRHLDGAAAPMRELGPCSPDGAVATDPFAIYLTRVRQQLEKYKVFPSAARDRRETGEVRVVFSIAASGQAVAVTDAQGGSPLLQKAAVELVATQRFPAPPAGWDPARRLIIPIKYTLQ